MTDGGAKATKFAKSRQAGGFVELAPAQLLDDNWRELKFDLLASQNILDDINVSNFGSGYVYREANRLNSATHNRAIFWRTTRDMIELVEISTEFNLLDNKLRIKFTNSPVISAVNVIELSNSIALMIATLNSVHKIQLPHPKTTNNSILSAITSTILTHLGNYLLLNPQNNGSLGVSSYPICASSWFDNNDSIKTALAHPSGSITIVKFSLEDNSVTASEIKQVSMIERIWSRMPRLLGRGPDDSDNAAFIVAPMFIETTRDVLLFCFCRDFKIRIFSISDRELIGSINDSRSQLEHSQAFLSPASIMMKINGNFLITYSEIDSAFKIRDCCYNGIEFDFENKFCCPAPQWEALIDFAVTENKLLALAMMGEPTLCYIDLNKKRNNWHFVTLNEVEMTTNNYHSEIFWKNRFAPSSILKALIGLQSPKFSESMFERVSEKTLEDMACRILGDDKKEWTKFYNYCLQSHLSENKPLALLTHNDESVLGIIKRNNLSVLAPYTFKQDRQSNYSASCIEGLSSITLMTSLHSISDNFWNEDTSRCFEKNILEAPIHARLEAEKVVTSSEFKLNLCFHEDTKDLLFKDIDTLLQNLDLTKVAKDYCDEMKGQESPHVSIQPNCYLNSEAGILLTFSMFKGMVRTRYSLLRDLLILVKLLDIKAQTEDWLFPVCQELYRSLRVRQILDALRSYATLIWISEARVSEPCQPMDNKIKLAIELVIKHFEYFKKFLQEQSVSDLERTMHKNLLIDFMMRSGFNYSKIEGTKMGLSNSRLVISVATNLCKLLWPKADHICFAEFLITHNLEYHLSDYMRLISGWVVTNEADMLFANAICLLIQRKAVNSVDLFNSMWIRVTETNLMGRFAKIPSNIEQKTPLTGDKTALHRWYEAVIEVFQAYDHTESLILLITQCIAVLSEDATEREQGWINCFRTQLFKYYLEEDNPEEAYQTMVHNGDESQRANCLQQFIVYHCERQMWSDLLSYPYFDIRKDFIGILEQRASISDLSKQLTQSYYKTSYYEVLYSAFIPDAEFKRAAKVMYDYSQRLAHEVPGILSVKKQSDCLLVCLNTLRCVEEDHGSYFEIGDTKFSDGNRSVLKRALDSEPEYNSSQIFADKPLSRVTCKQVKMEYELTKARMLLLEKDSKANSIALSPLRVEDTVEQLVSSSLFSSAMKFAIFFKAPIETIMEGLTAKHIFLSQLSAWQIANNLELLHNLGEIISGSYSLNIDTYKYIANSECSFADKLWRLIMFYLDRYDGVGHLDKDRLFGQKLTVKTTATMRVVAKKLLESGYNVPASLKELYMKKYTSELLALYIKFDKLIEAGDLASVMLENFMAPARLLTSSQPIYIPTHLVRLLIEYLSEDATNKEHIKLAHDLKTKLGKCIDSLKN